MVIGKSFSGKTTFIETLCQAKPPLDLLDTEDSKGYVETPGILVTHLYWPVKMFQVEKFVMFNLSVWDVGKLASTKYDYILPVKYNLVLKLAYTQTSLSLI